MNFRVWKDDDGDMVVVVAIVLVGPWLLLIGDEALDGNVLPHLSYPLLLILLELLTWRGNGACDNNNVCQCCCWSWCDRVFVILVGVLSTLASLTTSDDDDDNDDEFPGDNVDSLDNVDMLYGLTLIWSNFVEFTIRQTSGFF
jgi:hypothetical protein